MKNFCGNLQTSSTRFLNWAEILVQWVVQNWTQPLAPLILSPLVELFVLCVWPIAHMTLKVGPTTLQTICYAGSIRVFQDTHPPLPHPRRPPSSHRNTWWKSNPNSAWPEQLLPWRWRMSLYHAANSTQGWYIISATSAETRDRQAFQHFWLGDLALNTHTDACTWSPGCLYSCPSVGMALRQLTR